MARSIFALLAAATCFAQEPLTLSKAVDKALENYPSIRVNKEQSNAAAAAIRLARTAYLPRVEALAQVNRATRNNVFGLLLPQSVIPPMSGPVIGSNNFGTVWGSAVGGLVSWEPFDFGLRGANVAAANASRALAEASVKKTQFEVSVAAVDAYLTLIAAQETLRAAQAGVSRADTIARTIKAQVDAQLRAGADQSRADAEVAAALTQKIRAQQAVEVARANLAQYAGIEPTGFEVAIENLVSTPAEHLQGDLDTAANPVMMEQAATLEQARAQLRVLERSYFPKFYLQGAAYSRGTGAELNGARLGGLNGLAPTVQDYALGFTVTFSILDLPAVRAREAAQTANIRSQLARSEQMTIELRAQWNRAVADLKAARAISHTTPVEVKAASEAVKQASARYEAGLGNIDDLAEAQRLLTQAEIDDALARLGVWRALLSIASTAGDIRPFVAEASR